MHARIFQEVQFDTEIPICEDMDTALRILNRGTPRYEMKERTTVYVAYPDSFTWGDPQKWQRELDALHSIFARREFQSKLPLDACRLRKAMAHPLDRAVVEVRVGDLEFGGKRRFVDGEAVVL